MGSLLLAWSRSFDNFDEQVELYSFFGWTNETASIPCSWSGILCYDDGTLRITLEYTGMTGRADAVGQPKARAWGLLLPNCHSLQHT